MRDGALVDWGLAERVAGRVSGADGADRRPLAPQLGEAELAAACSEGEGLIRSYSGLGGAGAVPEPEPVGRAEWSRSALGTLRDLADELQRSHGVEVSLPGPLGGIARSAIGAATGAEVGLAAGYAARRVLGQYDLAIAGPERPPRLLFVAPNIAGAARELDVDIVPFSRWVALHETTHAIQFASAPWLREHLGELIRELIAATASGLGLGELLKRAARNPREAVSGFLRGDLARAIAGPEHAPALDAIQATMTVLEGHAEHVMDAAAGSFVDDVGALRAKLRSRRAGRGPLEALLARLLGIDLKLRQYELGKRFCDAVAAEGGIGALNAVWEGPAALPSLSELEHPSAWLERSAAGSPSPAAAL